MLQQRRARSPRPLQQGIIYFRQRITLTGWPDKPFSPGHARPRRATCRTVFTFRGRAKTENDDMLWCNTLDGTLRDR